MATSDHTGKGGSLRDEQKRLTRRLLIEGAVTSFERKGYAATTIEDIVAEANASRATFYLHFKSKADVVLVVARTLGRRWRELYLELTSGGRPSRQGLHEWIDSMVDNYATNRGSLKALDQAEAIEPEIAAVRLANHEESIAVIAASIRRWCGCGEEDAHVRAALLLAQIDGFLHFWIVDGIPFDRERAVGTLTDLWVSMLGLSQDPVLARDTSDSLTRR